MVDEELTKSVPSTVRQYFEKYQRDYPNDLIDHRMMKLSDSEWEYVTSHSRRFQETFDMVPQIRDGEVKVLDVGIAYGHLSYCIKKLLNYDVYGVDIRRIETPFWQKRLTQEGIHFQLCDVTKQPLPFPDKSFDLALFTEVIEHIWPPTCLRILNEIRRVLKQNGTLVASTPNQVCWKNRKTLLLGSPLMDLNAYYVLGPAVAPGSGYGHIFLYTSDQLSEILKKANYRIQEIRFTRSGKSGIFEGLVYSLFPRLRDYILLRARA